MNDKKKLGAPTKYREEYDEQARKLCLLGATDKDIADFFDVTEQTINNWKKEFPSFFESLKRGKIIADASVAEKLFHRAIGYSHPEVKIATADGKITDSQEFQKHYAPDPVAAIFWLKNRQPDKWRDKQVVSHEGQIQTMSDEDINKRLMELIGAKPDESREA
ncbi:MAG: helix-turn-helix domain-containing protein [Plesiomonas shigelloides]